MAKIVDGAVQAYFVRHAMNVDPLACRDLVTDIVETLIAPVAAAEGENRVRETIPLADVLERLITSATLRGAIRSKLRTGASREMISFLIRDFAPAGLHSDRIPPTSTAGYRPRVCRSFPRG
jgi:hypothetical protein